MTLYDKLNNQINVPDFHNDTMLFVGGKFSTNFTETFSKYPLTQDELNEHAGSITFWQDKYDLATDDYGRRIIRNEMDVQLMAAYVGCDRQVIDEDTFTAIIGETITTQGIQRILPFLVDNL